jgi:two-component system, OmpR family, sensor histidine kinase KdpD
MKRGKLRVYLGAAPGVGKTFAMLNEGTRRADRGSDVVVAFLETHERINTAAQVGSLEVIPRRTVSYRDAQLGEMDLDAVLARKPEVALVDELAHTNVPGSRNTKRWQDIETLLAAGIDVITTVNVQHLESLNDVVQRITGIEQRETVPDAVVRGADQIELVDMSPESLRRRMAHGNVYPADRIDAALGNYFRAGNLGALRELALLWVADRVEESLHDYLVSHGIGDVWETRERIVVAITGAPGGDTVIRRASRLASRSHADLLGVRVVPADGLAAMRGPELESQRWLLSEVGGRYHEVVGNEVAAALVDFAVAERATQLVVGASRKSRWKHLMQGSVVGTVLRRAGTLDVHVISTSEVPNFTSVFRLPNSALSARRRFSVLLASLFGLFLLTGIGIRLGSRISLSTVLLLSLVFVVAIAANGGTLVGVAAALTTSLTVNWYFVPPVHTFTISDPENVVSLVVFVAVAVGVSVFADRMAQRSGEALRARAEAEALARTTATLVGEADPLASVLSQIRSVFEFSSASVLSRGDTGSADNASGTGSANNVAITNKEVGENGDNTAKSERSWIVEAVTGQQAPTKPEDGESFNLNEDGSMVLVVIGPQLGGDNRRVLHIFADQLCVALTARVLQREAIAAETLVERDLLRTAMLQAVSHDLRTPLASIKTSVTTLLQPSMEWATSTHSELLATIDSETDRLNRLVGNLLDMSRLQAGVLAVQFGDVALEDVVGSALASLSQTPTNLTIDVQETVPLVHADATLLERVLANVVSNAIQWSPDGQISLSAGLVGDRVHLRIVDHGPGIPEEMKERVLQPFQRLGDQPTSAKVNTSGTGVGLGLAVANGFVVAMNGELRLEDTPGGGLTVIIDLLAAGGVDSSRPTPNFASLSSVSSLVSGMSLTSATSTVNSLQKAVE